ncbi:MAG: XrtA/PEP-CTERM system TPR-repeat protein PrsT [Gammaproteobacteria bacterium]
MRKTTFLIAACLLALPLHLPAADTAAAARYYEDGLKRFDAGDFDAAAIQLKNALAKDPGLLPAHVLLGRTRLEQGKSAEAEKELLLALQHGADRQQAVPLLAKAYLAGFKHRQLLDELKPESVSGAARFELLVLRAQAQIELDEIGPAREQLAAAALINPGSPKPLVGEAMAALRSGNTQAADTAIARALELDPAEAEPWNVKGSIHHMRGELAQAAQAYSKAIELQPRHREARVARVAVFIDLNRDRDAEADLVYLAEHYPEDPRPAYLRALKLARGGDMDGARSNMAEAAGILDQLAPDFVNRNDQLLMLGGIVNFSLQKPERAREFLERYVARNGTAVGALKLLGAVHLQLGTPDKAVSVLTPAQQLAPADPHVLTLLANAWMALGRYERSAALLERAAASPAAGSDIRSVQAVNRLLRGDTDAALSSLDRILKDDPKQARASLLKALAHVRRSEFRQALAIADAQLARQPGNLTWQNLRASALNGIGDRAGARALYEQILRAEPAFLPAAVNLARMDAADGKPGAALQRLKALLKSRPKEPLLYMELARFEDGRGQPRAAIQWLEQGRTAIDSDIELRIFLTDLLLRVGETERAARVAWEVQARAPDDLTVLDSVVRVQVAQGQKDLARVTLKRMADLASSDTKWLYDIAMRQLAVDAGGDARYNLGKLVQGSPEFQPAWVALIELTIGQRNAARAAELIRDFQQRWPQSAVGQRLHGDLALIGGDVESAIERYQIAYTREPGTTHAVALGAALVSAGQAQKARTLLREWVAAHPRDVAAMHALAEAELAAGDRAAATEIYRRLVALRPQDAAALNNLAYLLSEADDPAAQGFAERAHKLAPDDPSASDTLGWILVRQGKAEAGLRLLREAQARSTQSPAIRYHIAVALDALGRRDEARRELDKALAGDARFAEAEAARKLRARLGPGG